MQEYDWKEIKHFTKKEVELTGADLNKIEFRLMYALNALRHRIGRRIGLLENGLTSGDHKSVEHREGLAVDFFLFEKDGPINNWTLYSVIRNAIDIGFRGVGLYKNEKGYWSIHMDLREETTFWIARRGKDGGWDYSPMLWGEPA